VRQFDAARDHSVYLQVEALRRAGSTLEEALAKVARIDADAAAVDGTPEDTVRRSYRRGRRNRRAFRAHSLLPYIP
jgi:hypothetical protein